MHAVTGRADGPDRRRRDQGALIAPARVVIPRPRRGWVAGLLATGTRVIAGLVAVAVALAVLAGLTVALWWAGQAQVPVLVLVYGSVAVAGCGLALGRSGRLMARRPRLPEGPGQLTWPTRTGRVETGLVWEDPAITAPDGLPGEENCP